MGTDEIQLHDLVSCPACNSLEVTHNAGIGVWKCGTCGSEITEEGVEALATGEHATVEREAAGPLDEMP